MSLSHFGEKDRIYELNTHESHNYDWGNLSRGRVINSLITIINKFIINHNKRIPYSSFSRNRVKTPAVFSLAN